MPSVCEDAEKVKSLYIVGGNVKCYNNEIMENGLAPSCKTKHILPIWPSNYTLSIYPRKIKTYFYTQKNIYKNVYRSFFF